MPKRLTYGFVRDIFSSCGYTLLSDEYKNNSSLLEYVCPRGHRGSVSYGNFSSGSRCRKCAIEERVSKNRVGIDKINEHFISEGYTLLSSEYTNNKQKLEFICPRGHRGRISWGHFNKGRRCAECARVSRFGPRYEYSEVRRIFEDRGYILKSSKYLGYNKKLCFQCPKGHIGYITLGRFKSGRGCGRCGREGARKRLEDIKAAFEHFGYTLLSDSYRNNYTKLKYECPDGHVGSMSWSNFNSGWRCPRCVCSGISNISQQWLDSVSDCSMEREVFLGSLGFRVDGYDRGTGTVYEFLGDFWHGNPEVYDPGDINPVNKKTFGQLYKETYQRFRLLEEAGYKVVYIWEKDFLEQKKKSVV